MYAIYCYDPDNRKEPKGDSDYYCCRCCKSIKDKTKASPVYVRIWSDKLCFKIPAEAHKDWVKGFLGSECKKKLTLHLANVQKSYFD